MATMLEAFSPFISMYSIIEITYCVHIKLSIMQINMTLEI